MVARVGSMVVNLRTPAVHKEKVADEAILPDMEVKHCV